MTDTEQAKYAAGDRLYFTPNLIARAPFGSTAPEGLVEVVEVVDHGTATPLAPRFSYVVRAFDGGATQGTDDRELIELPEPAAEPMAVLPRDGHVDVIYAARTDAAAIAARYLARGARVDMPDVWTVRVYGAKVDDAGALIEPEPVPPAAPEPAAAFAKAHYDVNEPGAATLAAARRMAIGNRYVTAETYRHPETNLPRLAVFVGLSMAYDGPMPDVAQGSAEFYAWVRAAAIESARTDETDAAEIDAAEDDRRIFQALCTERDRLAGLLACDPENVDRARTARLAAPLAHTVRLVDRYAAIVNAADARRERRSTGALGSGDVHPCRDHAPGAS